MDCRKDYGPAGCASGCAKRSAALVGAMGVGAFLFSLAAKAGWHVTTAFLRWRESRRG